MIGLSNELLRNELLSYDWSTVWSSPLWLVDDVIIVRGVISDYGHEIIEDITDSFVSPYAYPYNEPGTLKPVLVLCAVCGL